MSRDRTPEHEPGTAAERLRLAFGDQDFERRCERRGDRRERVERELEQEHGAPSAAIEQRS